MCGMYADLEIVKPRKKICIIVYDENLPVFSFNKKYYEEMEACFSFIGTDKSDTLILDATTVQ